MSETAQLQRFEGTPIGPPKKIIICHCPPGNLDNCRTIRVGERAVPAHLGHGDLLGPCPADRVVCRNGNTIVVNQHKVRPTDTDGPCENQVFMCNLRLRSIVVNPKKIEEHLARGHRLGLCPGRNLICHNGKTIVVLDGEVAAHLDHGDYLGYCFGAQGPLITNLPPSFVQQ